MCSPHGAFLVGEPKEVADKVLAMSATLGGVSRVNFQMSTASGDHEAMMRSIQLLGSEVAPLVRAETG
jgi:alkanesulfonate monooxygenase SsuD/methylene tetrahydromethanopterin reductase-like flavin-dependent oxidoreductase (luciferase family)